MSLLEHEAQTLNAFKSNVEDLALEELTRLEAERVALDEALTSVKDAIKSVRAVLSAARPPQAKKKEPSKAGAPFKMSLDREVAITDWLRGNEDEITSKTVQAQFPEWSGSYVNMALKQLRDDGVLRLAAMAGSMRIYRAMP